MGREKLQDNNLHESTCSPIPDGTLLKDAQYARFPNDSTELSEGTSLGPVRDTPVGILSGKPHMDDNFNESLRSPPRLPLTARARTRADPVDTTSKQDDGSTPLKQPLLPANKRECGEMFGDAKETYNSLVAASTRQGIVLVEGGPTSTEMKHGGHQPRGGPSESMPRATPAVTITHRLGSNHRNSPATTLCASSNSGRAVQDNWGSVFVVGGGRRRRRSAVRRRSSEAEETPATRRAQVRNCDEFPVLNIAPTSIAAENTLLDVLCNRLM